MSQSPSARLVRTADHDRWLCALFCDEERREAIFSLLAFNAELARIRETVSQAILGDIRLKWWEETVESMYGGAQLQHPLAASLAQAIIKYDLPKQLFTDILQGRSLDLGETAPLTCNDLIRYADLTGGALHALIARVLDSHMDHGRELGTTWALLGVLRAIPFHFSHGLVLLPQDMTRARGLSDQSFLQPENSDPLGEVVEEISGLIEERLSSQEKVSSFVFAEKSVLILARMYLKRLQQRGYDLHGPVWEIPAWKRSVRLWYGSITGR